MSASWHPDDDDATPVPRDVVAMAEVLEGQHGAFAAEIAEFFSTYHSISGDTGRCWAWAGVAEVVRKRELERMHGPTPTQASFGFADICLN
jgi:hypothetical protein